MPFTCWSCKEVMKTKDELRNHYMRLPHRFLKVVCAWCQEIFRRPVDLRIHMTERHRKLRREHGKDFPTDREAFFLATKPRAYLNSITGQPSDGPRVTELKEAVLKNPILGPAEKWQKGWDRHGPLSARKHSPTKPNLLNIESLSLDPEGGKVIVTGGTREYFQFTIPCEDPRIRDSLLRMMATVKPELEVPNTWTVFDGSKSAAILAAVGLTNMKASRVERNASATEEPPQKRQKTDLPPSPLTPLATPQHELQLEEPPFNNQGAEFPTPPALMRQVTPPSPPVVNPERYTPTSKGDAASQLAAVVDSPPPSIPSPPSAEAEGTKALLTDPDVPEEGLVQEANRSAIVPMPSNELSSRALHLLLAGGMPLFPPARRNWNQETSLPLPLKGSFQTWPPAGWKKMSPDTRLLLWETVSATLAVTFHMELDRPSILDSFQFLALPGSKDPIINTPKGHMRHANLQTIRKIALG